MIGLLIREPSTQYGTFGILTVTRSQHGSLSLDTLEPPWLNNAQDVSCIPCGEYVARLFAGKRGLAYRLMDVEGRTGIDIHNGSWAGDVSMGLRSHSKGCILAGVGRGTPSGQPGLLFSKAAIAALKAFGSIDGQRVVEEILLTVKWRS